jgi:hypothetical protein
VPVVSVREISVGERVEAVIGDGRTIHPGGLVFSLTPPRSGTLVVSLTWDPWKVGTLLKLTINGTEYRPQAPPYSPVVTHLPIESGKLYLIVVGIAGADWLPEDNFTLTTSLTPN